MDDYIKRSDVLEYMRSRLDMQDLYLPIHFIDFVIDEMPAADVRENVRGEWTNVVFADMDDPSVKAIDSVVSLKCGKCGRWTHQVYFYGDPKENLNYCHFCGCYNGGGKNDI